MGAKRTKYLVAVISLIVITGCASESKGSNETEIKKVNSQFLSLTSDSIRAEDKVNFDSLVFEEDKFTKEASFDLPDNEVADFTIEDTNDIQVGFSLTRGPKDEEFIPYMIVSYTGEDWLFMESAMLKVQDDVLSLSATQSPFRETMGYGYVSEFIIFDLNKIAVNMLGNSKSNSDLDIRMNGKYFDDIKLTSLEYKGMKKILSAYRYYLQNKNSL